MSCLLGNVWEWVAGGIKEQRVLRGGSFNHMTLVSTKHTNTADSAASNIGFRCVRTIIYNNNDNNKNEF